MISKYLSKTKWHLRLGFVCLFVSGQVFSQEESTVEVEASSVEPVLSEEKIENKATKEILQKDQKSSTKASNPKKNNEEKSKNVGPSKENETSNSTADAPLTVIDFVYEHPEKSFKMQVPSDWDVKKDYNNYELFMEPKVKMVPSAENPVVADPNITVKVLNRTVYLDQQGLDEYEKEIIQKFNEANGAGTDFQIFQKTVFDLTPTNKALLYDVTFKNNNYDIFQTIVVLSTEGRMYRLTLTDYKVFFDKNREKYFPILASVQIEGKPPSRVNELLKYAPWLIGFLIVMGAFMGIAIYRKKKFAQTFDLNSNDEGSELPVSQFSVGSTHSVMENKNSIAPMTNHHTSSPQSHFQSSNPSTQLSGFDGDHQESLPLSQAVGQPKENGKKDNKKDNKKDPPESSGFGVSRFED